MTNFRTKTPIIYLQHDPESLIPPPPKPHPLGTTKGAKNPVLQSWRPLQLLPLLPSAAQVPA